MSRSPVRGRVLPCTRPLGCGWSNYNCSAVSHSRHGEIGEAVAALVPPPDLLVTVGEDAHLIAAAAGRAGIPVRAFAAAEAAAAFVREVVLGFAGPQLLLIKGSRGARLEEVTRCVTEI